MPTFSRHDLILIRYPFSDLSSSKVRPAIIVNGPHVSHDLLIVPITVASKIGVFWMNVSIRPATLEDAPAIERLYAQSAAYLRALGDTTDFRFDARAYVRDGFGPEPAFAGIVALHDGQIVGYLLYTFGYDTDRALRYLYVLDLLVDEANRGRGIGRRLMEQAAAICREHDGAELFWAVYHRNTQAIAFYERLGARKVSDVVFMHLSV